MKAPFCVVCQAGTADTVITTVFLGCVSLSLGVRCSCIIRNCIPSPLNFLHMSLDDATFLHCMQFRSSFLVVICVSALNMHIG